MSHQEHGTDKDTAARGRRRATLDGAPQRTRDGHLVEREFAGAAELLEAVREEVLPMVAPARVELVEVDGLVRVMHARRGRWVEIGHGTGYAAAWTALVTGAQPAAIAQRVRLARELRAIAQLGAAPVGDGDDEEGGAA